MQTFVLTEEDKKNLVEAGWEVEGEVRIESWSIPSGYRNLLLLNRSRILAGKEPNSIIFALNCRGAGREVFKIVAEADLLLKLTLQKKRLLYITFNTEAKQVLGIWLELLLDLYFQAEVMLVFKDTSFYWKDQHKIPLEYKKSQEQLSQSPLIKKSKTYQNLFGYQSERILKYFILSKESNLISLNHISKSLQVSQSGVSRTFSALEEHGLVSLRSEGRALIPEIISGQKLLDAWLNAQQQRILGGNDFLYFKDPLPVKEEQRHSLLIKDLFSFLDTSFLSKEDSIKSSMVVSGQEALKLLGLNISNEQSIVIHMINNVDLNSVVKNLSLVQTSKRQRGILIVRIHKTYNFSFSGVQKVNEHHFFAADPISLYLDTLFAPQRGPEQREFLLEKIFAPLFKQRGWVL